MCVVSLFFPSVSALCAVTSTAGVKETDPSSTVRQSGIGVSLPQGSLGEWVPVEVYLNARGSVCPGLASLALMDMSVLLIAGLQEKMCISFFMHSLDCGHSLVMSLCPCGWDLCIRANCFGRDGCWILHWSRSKYERYVGKIKPHYLPQTESEIASEKSFKSPLRLTKCNWMKR